MSEKIYACLLRFFPSRFRDAYGDEALQLFRDRARDESGFWSGLRLWLDLLGDLVLSIPPAYFYAEPQLTTLAAPAHLGLEPFFFVLADERPRPGALALGGFLTLTALLSFPFLLSHGGNDRSWNAFRGATGASRAVNNSTGESQSTSGSAKEKEAWQATPHDASSTMRDMGALRTERQRVVAAVADNMKHHYVDRRMAQRIADSLIAHERAGDDDRATDGAALANLLTEQIRKVTSDSRLEVVYSQERLPEQPANPNATMDARYSEAMRAQNCLLERVEVVQGNIGYLKLNGFPARSVCEGAMAAAMRRLNQSDALIFDLRDNRGGEPETVQFLAAYLFDHPEYWYNPRENTTRDSWTRSPVPLNRLADKPIYLVTSPQTASGAEQFCYDLKMLRRATIIGERTRGAAHAGVWYRIDDHFGVGIPEVSSINPYGDADWADVGVEPDVRVNAAAALQTAEQLARSKLKR